MSKERKTIRVQPIATILLYLIISLCFLVMIVLLRILLEYQQGLTEFLYVLLSISFIFFFSWFLYNVQHSIIDESGITIKRLFFIIAKIKWNDIYAITENSLATHKGRGTYIFYKWLIISQNRKDIMTINLGGRNKKNKAPWFIIANNKNREIVKNFYSAATGKTIGY